MHNAMQHGSGSGSEFTVEVGNSLRSSGRRGRRMVFEVAERTPSGAAQGGAQCAPFEACWQIIGKE
jgi:hypothetical protein